jgi:hypothetical protein
MMALDAITGDQRREPAKLAPLLRDGFLSHDFESWVRALMEPETG